MMMTTLAAISEWGKGPVGIPVCHDLNPDCVSHR